MKPTTKNKMRELLSLALNKLVEKKLIDLKSKDDTKGDIFLKILGKPSKISWYGIGFGEIRLTVWWGIKPELKDSSCTLPLNKNIKDALETACSIWIERKNGIWLQGKGGEYIFDTYCSKELRRDLLEIKEVHPNGYQKEGAFYM